MFLSHLLSVHTMLWFCTNRAPDGALNQADHLSALLIDFCEHEALECCVVAVDLDSACHACSKLVTVAEELVAKQSKRNISLNSNLAPAKKGNSPT